MTIGAALWRDSNGKIYLFEDAHYYRISEPGDGYVDEGYPKYTSEHWPDAMESFEYGRIDAALLRSSNGKIYLFSGDQYIRYSRIADGVDEGYPMAIADHWPGLPDHFAEGIDAALMRGNGKIYFFKGDEYVRFTNPHAGVDPGYPKYIADEWHGMPDHFADGIDAALYRKDNGKIYLFCGDEYVRFDDDDVHSGVEDGYPQPVAGNWLPEYDDGGDDEEYEEGGYSEYEDEEGGYSEYNEDEDYG